MLLFSALKRQHIFARCSICLLVHCHHFSEQTSKAQAFHRLYDRRAYNRILQSPQTTHERVHERQILSYLNDS